MTDDVSRVKELFGLRQQTFVRFSEPGVDGSSLHDAIQGLASSPLGDLAGAKLPTRALSEVAVAAGASYPLMLVSWEAPIERPIDPVEANDYFLGLTGDYTYRTYYTDEKGLRAVMGLLVRRLGDRNPGAVFAARKGDPIFEFNWPLVPGETPQLLILAREPYPHSAVEG